MNDMITGSNFSYAYTVNSVLQNSLLAPYFQLTCEWKTFGEE